MNPESRFRTASLGCALATLCSAALASTTPQAHNGDARVLTLVVLADSVVRIPVQRGLITQIVLPQDERIVGSPATGRGADCAEPTHTWCVATQAGDIFVKPRTGASRTNLVVTTTKRRYAFDLQPVSRGETPLIRLTMIAPAAPTVVASPAVQEATQQARREPVTASEILRTRWAIKPAIRNDAYSVANGPDSEDIVPTMVFDDGTHTYFQFPNNRPVPSVFQIAPDGSEQTVNARMDTDDMLVADRVARRFVLRLGRSVVAIINDAFDLDGVAPSNGTTVPGVARAVKQNTPTGTEQ